MYSTSLHNPIHLTRRVSKQTLHHRKSVLVPLGSIHPIQARAQVGLSPHPKVQVHCHFRNHPETSLCSLATKSIIMMYGSVILGLLASSALARPQHGHAHLHKRLQATGSGAAPYPTGNSTLPFANSTGAAVAAAPIDSTSTVQSVITRTVVPVPVASAPAAPAAVGGVSPAPVDANNQVAAGAATAPQAPAAAACGASQSTTTITTTELVTLTVGGDAPAATPAKKPAEFFAPTYPSSAPAPVEAAPSPAATSYPSSASAQQAPASKVADAAAAPAASSPAAEAPAAPSPSVAEAPAAAAPASSTSAAASPTVSSTAGTNSGSKRGLAYNDASLTDFWSGKPVSWAYNWADSPGGTVGSDLEYVPMAWCSSSISVSDWTTAANSALSSGSTHLLGFNEPDQPGQCDIDPSATASGHKEYMNPFAGKAKIGSPAVTNGGGSMGLTFLQNFFDACGGSCTVDFLNIHWYGGAGDGVVDNFKSHISSAVEVAKKNNVAKVWVTEFALDGADEAATASFLGEVLPFLDGLDEVERYAFFMAKEGSLVQGKTISPTIGAAYVA